MKKLLYTAVVAIGFCGICEGMQLSQERSDLSAIKMRDIPEDSTSIHTSFMQGDTFVCTYAINLNKLCSDVIKVLSDEGEYAPDVNDLLRNEKLLKQDNFPASLNFLTLLSPFVSPEKKATISSLVPHVTEFIYGVHTSLDTEYSGNIELDELKAVKLFYLERLKVLERFRW